MEHTIPDADFDPALDCCHRGAPGQNHALDCFTGLGGEANAPHPPLGRGDAPERENPRLDARAKAAVERGETGQERCERIEAELAVDFGPLTSRADVGFLLDALRLAGNQRVQGLREAVGLIRAAKQREVTTRFLAGKKEQTARAMNSKLLDTVANLIEKYAADAADGRV